MSAITTLATHVQAPVNFVLMRGLLTQARKVLPYYNGTVPGELMKNGGSMSVKWRRFDDLSPATTALGEKSGNLAFQNGRTAATPTVTDITVAVQKYGNFVNVAEELDLFNVNSRAAQIMDVLGRNAGETLNELTRDGYTNGVTKVRYAGGVANDSATVTALDDNDVKSAVNELQRNSAMKFFARSDGSTMIGSSPVRASYYGIAHADAEFDIRALDGFIGVEQYGSHVSDIQVGEIGHAHGVRWSITETGPISTGVTTGSASGFRGTNDTTNDVYATYIYGREAVGTVGLGENHTEETYLMGDRIPTVMMFQDGPGTVADPLHEMATLAWKAWHAVKVLNTDWVIGVRHLATDYSI